MNRDFPHPVRFTLTLAAGLAMGILAPRAGQADTWRMQAVAGPGAVSEIVQSGANAVVVRTGQTWQSAHTCSSGVCLAPGRAPDRRRPPKGGLADGWTAQGTTSGIARAWYAEPTERYGHGILGDRIEAAALVVEDHAGRRHTLRLPRSLVFEDLAPRLADIDGDGQAEVVAIRSSIDRGAAVAVYGLDKTGLHSRAATPYIGRSNRWLNIAGIADFDGDGRQEIALVKTPHIGGTLEFWGLRSGKLTRIAARPGFSNHAIGSRSLDLSAIADTDGDGRPELALPDAGRKSLQIVRLVAGQIESVAIIALPRRIARNIGSISDGGRPTYLIGLDNGALLAVTR